MAEEEATLVGERVSHLREQDAAPGSEKVLCSRCGEVIWVAPTSRALRDSGVRVICLDCFAETYKGGQIMVTEETLKEVAQVTGRPFSMADATRIVADFLRSHGKGGRG